MASNSERYRKLKESSKESAAEPAKKTETSARSNSARFAELRAGDIDKERKRLLGNYTVTPIKSSKTPAASDLENAYKERYVMPSASELQRRKDTAKARSSNESIRQQPARRKFWQEIASGTKDGEYNGKYQGMTYEEVQERLHGDEIVSDDERRFLEQYGTDPYGLGITYASKRDYDLAIDELQKAGAKSRKNIESIQRPATVGTSGAFGQTENAQVDISGDEKQDNELQRLEYARRRYDNEHRAERYYALEENADFLQNSQMREDVDESDPYALYNYKMIHGLADYDYAANQDRDYDQMTDRELKIYDYIFNTQGGTAAQEYLDHLEVDLSKRRYDKESAELEEKIGEGGALTGALYTGKHVLENIPGAVGSTLENTMRALQGKEYNPYAYGNRMANEASDITQYVSEDISQFVYEKTGSETFGKAASFLYNVGVSYLDSQLGAKVTKGLMAMGDGGAVAQKIASIPYGASMGLNAFQSTAKELKEEGASDTEIALQGMAAGVAECLFEEFSIEKLVQIKKADTLLLRAKEALKQAWVEGSEEVFTDISNMITDGVIRGEMSGLSQKWYEYRREGQSDQEASLHLFLSDICLPLLESGVAGALAGGLAGFVNSGSIFRSAKKTGAAIRNAGAESKIQEIQGGTNLEQYRQDLEKRGVTDLSDAQLGFQYQAALEDAETDETGDTAEKLMDIGYDVQMRQEMDAREKAGKEYKVEDNGDLTITGVKTGEDGTQIFETNKGEFAAEDIKAQRRNAEIMAAVDGMSDEQASLFAQTYDRKQGTSINQYRSEFQLAYTAGTLGYGQEVGTYKSMSPSLVGQVYAAGVKNQALEKQRMIDRHLQQALKGGNTRIGTFDDSAIDYTNSTKDGSRTNWKDLTQKQQEGIVLTKAVAMATGADIRLFASPIVNGKHVGKNGSYNTRTGQIEVDIFADNFDGDSILLNTLSHEITHWAKDRSPALYNELRGIVVNTLTSAAGMNEEALVQEELRRMVRQNEATLEDIREGRVTHEDAVDELIARSCEDMLSNSEKIREMVEQLSEPQKKSLLKHIKEVFTRLRDAFKALAGQFTSRSAEAKVFREQADKMDQLMKTWEEMIESASTVAKTLPFEGKKREALVREAMESDTPVQVGEDFVSKNSTQLSMRTWEQTGEKTLTEFLKNSDLSAEAQKQILDQMKWAYDLTKKYSNQKEDFPDFHNWQLKGIEVGEDGQPVFSVVVNNGEYDMNLDFSTVCKKRKTLDRVLVELAKSGDLDVRTLNQKDFAMINRVIKKHNFEIACALCFVDSKRYRTGLWAASFVNGTKKRMGFNDMVKSLVPEDGAKIDYFNFSTTRDAEGEGRLLSEIPDSELDFTTIDNILEKNTSKSAEYRMALAIKENPSLRHLLAQGDLMQSEGIEGIKGKNLALYNLVNAHQGAAKPKLAHQEVAYGSEILLDRIFNRDDAYAIGGVRLQSFSDYMANMVFDYLQMTADLAAKGMPVHAYSKETSFIEMFGQTGMKLNMSLVMAAQSKKYAGLRLDENGKPVEIDHYGEYGQPLAADGESIYLFEDETFSYEDALRIRQMKGYDANCGTIAVGISNEHIWRLLADPTIDMVIPYHKSAINKLVAEMRNIDLYNDYTSVQNTRYRNSKKKVPASVENWNFNEAVRRLNDPRAAAQEYKDLCEKNGWIPKFDKFAGDPNYYKLLEDFRVYDGQGNYAPQQDVRMQFPSNFETLMVKSLTAAQETSSALEAAFTREQDNLMTDVRGVLELKHSSRGAGEEGVVAPVQEKFSMRAGVEETKDLIAVHNFRSDMLRSILALGGLPSPSIAVVLDRLGHTNYGDISFVFRKFTIDPKRSRKNRIYSQDGWTPTFPQIDYSISEKAHREFLKHLDALIPQEVRDIYRSQYQNVERVDAIERAAAGYNGEIFDKLFPMDLIRYAYLNELGLAPEIATREASFGNGLETKDVVDFAEHFSEADLERMRRESYADAKTALENNPEAVEIIEGQRRNDPKYATRVQKGLPLVLPLGLRNMAEAALEYKREGLHTEVDEAEFGKRISDLMEGRNEAFEQWGKELVSGLIEKAGIWNGKDEYTPDGRRRSWSATHDDLTLDNIVRAMNRENATGANTSGAHAMFAVFAREYKSIQEMKARSGQLGVMDQDAYDKMRQDQYDTFAEIVRKSTPKGYSDDWAADEIIDIVKRCTTAEQIDRAIQNHSWLNHYDGEGAEIAALREAVADNPTGYFEAKPQRAVPFSEVAYALVPDDLDNESLALLQQAGIPVETYHHGAISERVSALNQTADQYGVKFSNRGAGRRTKAEYLRAPKTDCASTSVSIKNLIETTLTMQEWAHFRKNIADKKRRETFPYAAGGGIIVENEKGNKLIYTDAKWSDPGVERVIVINTLPEDYQGVKDYIYDAEDGIISDVDARRIIEDYFGEDAVSEYTFEAGRDAERYDRFGKRGNELSAAYHAQRQRERRSFHWETEGDEGVKRASRGAGLVNASVDLVNATDSEVDAALDAAVEKVQSSTFRFQQRSYEELTQDLKVSEAVNKMLEEYGERMERENKQLKADYEDLQERLILAEAEKGSKPTVKADTLHAAAQKIKKAAQTGMPLEEIKAELREIYTFASNGSSDWAGVLERCQDLAEKMNAQAGEVDPESLKLANEIRSTPISLSESQKQEARNAWGKQGALGKLNVKNGAISLDQKWQEWAEMYPAYFDANVTEGEQVTRLAEIREQLLNNRSAVEEYFLEDALRNMAFEIYNTFWTASNPLAGEVSENAKKQIEALNAKHRKVVAEMREAYDKRLDDAVTARRIYDARKQAQALEKKDQQIAELKAAKKEATANLREQIRRRAEIDAITTKALRLNRKLKANSKDDHVPEFLKPPVIALLNAIDFSSKRLLGMSGGDLAYTETQRDISLADALQKVHEMAAGMNKSLTSEDLTSVYEGYLDLPPGFADDILGLAKTASFIARQYGDNQYVLQQMSSAELHDLNKAVTVLAHSCTQADKALASRTKERISVMANKTWAYLDSFGKMKDRNEGVRKILDFVTFHNATPFYAFKRMGGSEVFSGIKDGMSKYAFNVQRIFDFVQTVYTEEEVKAWAEETHEFDVLNDKRVKDGEKTHVKMTTAQIMSLYCLQKREQGKKHLLQGGMRVANFKEKQSGKILKTQVTQAEGVTLTESEIARITGTLTARQKQVADRLQEFMNTVCSDWGNEITMARFGILGFGEENYFPIRVDRNSLATDDTGEKGNSMLQILNMSFTKALNENARNPVIISDVFDVFANHASQMAQYNAFSLPVLDAFKWFNFKTVGKAGDTQSPEYSIKKSLEMAFGEGANKYIAEFMRNLNGDYAGGRSNDGISGRLLGSFKAASVAGNLRVAALQPTAYLRASAVIDPKYLAAGMNLAPMKYAEKAKKYSGLALWKSFGYYDTNTTASVTDKIKYAETKVDKFIDKTMSLAEKGDTVTWGALWKAVEAETRDKQPGLKYDSEAFLKACADRFDEIILQTQVMDSVITRSEMMRSKNYAEKIATNFFAEPTLSLNLLMDKALEWHDDARRHGGKATGKLAKPLGRAFVAYTVTNVLAAFVESFFDALRSGNLGGYDGDDEDDDIVGFLKNWLSNFAQDEILLNKIPYVKDVISIWQGFDPTRPEMEMFASTIKGLSKIFKDGVFHPKLDAYGLKQVIKGLSQGTGIPVYNLYRDGKAIIDAVGLGEALTEIWNSTFGDLYPSMKIK